jgi:hypothetical protein
VSLPGSNGRGERDDGDRRNSKADTFDLKLAFLVLVISTTVWGIAFASTLREYQKYLEEWRHSDWSEWGLANPYWMWNGGTYAFVTGEFLLLGWVAFLWNLLAAKVYPHLKRWSEKKWTR